VCVCPSLGEGISLSHFARQVPGSGISSPSPLFPSSCSYILLLARVYACVCVCWREGGGHASIGSLVQAFVSLRPLSPLVVSSLGAKRRPPLLAVPSKSGSCVPW